MKKSICLLVSALLSLALVNVSRAQHAPTHYLLTYQLADGVEVVHLTQPQMAALQGHGQHLMRLQKENVLMVAARTADPVRPSAVAILTGDEATAQAAASQDPAAKAGVMKISVQPLGVVLPPAPPAALVSDTRLNYDMVSKYVINAAKKMPAEDYSFRPTPGVRSFAQVVAHIAETQYIACSVVRGEEYKPRNLEQNLSGKADLIPALEKAVAFCRESWSNLTPAALADPVKLFGRDRTKLGVLDISTAHAFEHYGNIVTYLRLKGIVPPSSE